MWFSFQKSLFIDKNLHRIFKRPLTISARASKGKNGLVQCKGVFLMLHYLFIISCAGESVAIL